MMMDRERIRKQRCVAITERLEKRGLAGMKIGRHKVAERGIEVQLGEHLSETLRGLKVCACPDSRHFF